VVLELAGAPKYDKYNKAFVLGNRDENRLLMEMAHEELTKAFYGSPLTSIEV
jgi:hypothetical protein